MGILNREILFTILEMAIVFILVIVSIPVWNNVKEYNKLIASAEYYSSNSYKNINLEKIQTQNLNDLVVKSKEESFDKDKTILLLRNITKYNVDYTIYLKLNKINDNNMYINIDKNSYKLNELYKKTDNKYNYYEIGSNKLEAHKGKKYEVNLWNYNNKEQILSYEFIYEEK